MSSGPSLGVAYLTVLPTMKGSGKIIEQELGRVPTAAIGGKLGKQLSGGLKATATASMAAVGAAAGIAFVRGFGRLKAIDTAKAKLKGLGNDAKTIELVMENAGASVRGTAFGLDAAATAAAGAMAAGIKPGKELERNLKLVADAATIAGTDMGSMGAIFNKAAASNKVQMDVINQLHDAGVPALSFIAKTMGVTAEEASKMASKGEINFKIFQDAMEQGLGGAALSSGDTFSGAMANVFAALGRIGAGIMGGVFPKLAPLFQRIQAALGPVEERAAALGAVIGEKLTPILDRVMGLLEGGTGKLESLKGVIGPLSGAFAALGASGLAPLLGMVPGLGGFAGMLAKLGGPLGIISGLFLGMVATSPELQSALQLLLGSLGEIVTALAPSLQQIAGILSGVLAAGLVGMADGLTVVVGWLSQAISAIAPYSDLLVSLGLGIGGVVVAVKAWTLAGNTLKAAMAIWKVAQAAWTAASYGAVGASYAVTAATKGQAIAVQVATGAQRVFNTVLRANPLGLIITAITAVVGALVWFFTQTDTGKKMWAEFTRFLGEAWTNISGFFTQAYESVIKPVFDGIGAAATWVFDHILKPAFEGTQWAFAVLGGIIQGVYEAILKPVFDGVAAVFQWIYQNVIVPVILGIQLYIRAWGAIFTWLYETAVKPAIDAIGKIVNWIYQNVIVPIVAAVQQTVRGWGRIFTWLYETAVKPAIDAIGAAVNWIHANVIVPIVAGIKQQIDGAGKVFTWLYQNAVKPAIDGVGRVFTWLYDNVIEPVWTGISNTISSIWTKGIKPVIDGLVKLVKMEPKKAFEAARDGIGVAWRAIQGIAKKPVKFVIETVIGGLIDTVNKIPGVNLPKPVLPKGFAGGGVIPGYNPHRTDSVLTPMRPGEGVLVPEVVRGLGAGFVHALNAAGNNGGVDAVRRQWASIGPGLAKGGLVTPLPKGSYSVSQPYHSGHNGIDLAAAQGTPIRAAAAGIATDVGWVNMGGMEVRLQHPDGFATRYSHLSAFAIGQGDKVRQGQLIGRVGSTGMSTGPHLHYMVHTPPGGWGNMTNPAPYLGIHGKGWDPLGDLVSGIADWAAGKFEKAFPGSGMWIDAARGLMTEAVSGAIGWAKGLIGLDDIGTTLYDSGGLLPTGISLVENRTGSPEPVLTASRWRELVDRPTGSEEIHVHVEGGGSPTATAREAVRALRRHRFEKRARGGR